MMLDDDVPPHLGRYEVLGRIALGALTEVLLAQFFWPGTDDARLVVIKRPRAELAGDAAVVRRFFEAAMRAAALMHANIVTIFEVDQTANGVVVVMETLWGRELRALSRRLASRRMRMPLGLTLHLVRAVSFAIDHAHTRTDATGAPRGVIHGDVSPHHVHVGFNGDVRVRDFESAGLREGRTGTTPSAPGQGGHARDQRSDVFDLGLLLYELINGQRYRGEEPPPRSKDDADYPAALEKVVRAALARDRAKRTETAGQLAAQLDEVSRKLKLRENGEDLARFMKQLYASELARRVGDDRAERVRAFRAQD